MNMYIPQMAFISSRLGFHQVSSARGMRLREEGTEGLGFLLHISTGFGEVRKCQCVQVPVAVP